MDRAAMFRHMKDCLRNTSPTDPMQSAFNQPEGYFQARIERAAQDPKYRSLLLSQENLQLMAPFFNWVPGMDVPPEMEEAALDLAINPGHRHAMVDEHRNYFSERNVYLGDFIDDSVIGLALELQGLPAEEVYQRLRREIFEAVMLHEIGHTVGLRHNFEASTDALNYPDEFWQIREQFAEDEWKEQRLLSTDIPPSWITGLDSTRTQRVSVAMTTRRSSICMAGKWRSLLMRYPCRVASIWRWNSSTTARFHSFSETIQPTSQGG